MTAKDKSVAVLTHARDDFDANDYFLRFFFPCWQRRGFTVRLVRGIETSNVTADVAISHVNLTTVPAEYRLYAERFPVVVNGRVDDISKTRIATHLVERASEYEGSVIVKTNLNYGGRPERWQTHAATRLGRMRLRLERNVPWTWSGALDSTAYKIYERARDVPRAVWWNPGLVVQRYLPERQGSFYCLRNWVFFGDREMSSIAYAESPLVKATNAVKRDLDVPIPDRLREIRARLGFDYGKFDFGIVDGEVVLYDANRTPTRSRDLGVTSELEAAIENLAHGIDAFTR
jgi:hypothetical protein